MLYTRHAYSFLHGITYMNNVANNIYNGSYNFPFVNLVENLNTINSEIVYRPYIKFRDPEVKRICVANWGGNYISGEITYQEAAAVQTLGRMFKNNTIIQYFDELKYFTGLKHLAQHKTDASDVGEFQNCSNLRHITIPKAPIDCIDRAFQNCTNLEECDLSPITATLAGSVCRFDPFANCLNIKRIIMPKITLYATSNERWFYYCKKLEYIDASNLNFVNCKSLSNFFEECRSLKYIKGGLKNLALSNFGLGHSKLTHDAIVELLQSLGTKNGSGTSYIGYDASDTPLTDEEKAIATDKGWTISYTGY